MIAPSHDSGFALTETLVSAAIIAVMLGVTFQSITASAQQSRMIEERRAALLVAQSQIAAANAATSTSFGDVRGVSNDIAWRITIASYRGAVSASVPLELVTVSSGNGMDGKPLISLKTLRIAR